MADESSELTTLRAQVAQFRDVETDYDQIRELLARDMTQQPSTEPLPDLPAYVGAVAFSLYGAIQELRQLRAQVAQQAQEIAELKGDTSKELSGKQIRKGTGNVMKDLQYAHRFTSSIQDSWGGQVGLEIDFVDRALRMGMNEIRQLQERVQAKTAQLEQAESTVAAQALQITMWEPYKAALEEKVAAQAQQMLVCEKCGGSRYYCKNCRCPDCGNTFRSDD